MRRILLLQARYKFFARAISPIYREGRAVSENRWTSIFKFQASLVTQTLRSGDGGGALTGTLRGRFATGSTFEDAGNCRCHESNLVVGPANHRSRNDDHAYFYNTTFARRSAETYAALLGVDPELEGAPSRENSGPPRLVVSIDTRSGSTPRIGCLASRHLRFLWLVMVVAILLAYFFSASGP